MNLCGCEQNKQDSEKIGNENNEFFSEFNSCKKRIMILIIVLFLMVLIK